MWNVKLPHSCLCVSEQELPVYMPRAHYKGQTHCQACPVNSQWMPRCIWKTFLLSLLSFYRESLTGAVLTNVDFTFEFTASYVWTETFTVSMSIVHRIRETKEMGHICHRHSLSFACFKLRTSKHLTQFQTPVKELKLKLQMDETMCFGGERTENKDFFYIFVFMKPLLLLTLWHSDA